MCYFWVIGNRSYFRDYAQGLWKLIWPGIFSELLEKRLLCACMYSNKNVKGKNHKNVACKNSIIYKNLPIFRTDKPYFIRVWKKCCGIIIYAKNITVTRDGVGTGGYFLLLPGPAWSFSTFTWSFLPLPTLLLLLLTMFLPLPRMDKWHWDW